MYAALGLGAAAWAGAGLAGAGQVWLVLVALLGAALVGLRGRVGMAPATWVLAAACAFVSGSVHLALASDNPLPGLAAEGAVVRAEVVVGTDPVPSPGRFADQVHVQATVRDLVVRGRRYRMRVPVLVLLPAHGRPVERGERLRVEASLVPADEPGLAAVLSVRTAPVVLGRPGVLTRAAAEVRAAIRAAVAGRHGAGAALVPALVDGDEAGLPDSLRDDFRVTGLTHLTAVSGTNLTLILGFVLLVARWCRVRARGLLLCGLGGVVGFLLLAGPQPSVLRAAAMGVIALIGMGAGGRQRGIRALGTGVLVLMLVDPGLARSPGFALSASATAGILLLGPPWRDALSRWLPRWAAEAVAVPLAAQLACTPLVAAISGQVSLVALAANLAAAPLVGPATVLGLVGGLVGLVSGLAGRVLATPAVWCGSAIVAIARHGAGLPVPAVGWSTTVVGLVLLTGLCAGLALTVSRVLVRRGRTLTAAGLLAVVVLVPLPTPGWPPEGWVLVACSVGQGDGLVLATGPHSAVVVDAGPDPRLMDGCLKRLGVRTVPVLVLTHFHADHVDGLSGVVHGRQVGVIETSPLADPAAGAAGVGRTAARAGIPVRVVTLGEVTRVGPVSWQVLGPPAEPLPDSDSPPNDASVVLVVQVRGIRLLLMGDEERPSQEVLRRDHPDLRVDVLKVAHHGSSKQDDALVDGLGARVAVISVGLGNDYGHPAGSTLDLLRRAGMQVRRTDQDGDVAVVVDGHGRISTVVHPVGTT